jgi:hypothetical protein
VPQRSTQTRRTTGQRRPASAGQSAYERLTASVDAAQVALKELRGELGRGSRELLKDVDLTLRDARKNLRRVSRQLVKELEQVQQAGAGKRAPARASRATTGGGRATAAARKRAGGR